MQQTSSALPISNAATRSMSSSVSCVSSSTRPPPRRPDNSTVARRSHKGQAESDPRAQGDSDGPTARLPAPGCLPTSTITGLRRQRATSPIFTQGGRPSREHGGCLGDDCPSSGLYGSVGSSQARLGGDSGLCGLVRCCRALWNVHRNDQLSKPRSRSYLDAGRITRLLL